MAIVFNIIVVKIDGWLDGWMDRWKEGWMDGRKGETGAPGAVTFI